MGFDDSEAGALITPTLSTVRQDFPAIGAKAAQLVLGLAGRQDVRSLQHRVPTRLVVRSSCGCTPDGSARVDELVPVPDRPMRDGLRSALHDLLTDQGVGSDDALEVAARWPRRSPIRWRHREMTCPPS